MDSTPDDLKLEEFHDELAFLLVRLGGLSRDAAWRVVRERYNPTTPMARMLLLHETPYYWVMSWLHARSDPEWYHDPALWPPPRDWFHAYDAAKEAGEW